MAPKKSSFRNQENFCGYERVSSNSLKKKGVVIINDQPCKIVKIAHSTPGKHGHKKTRVVGTNLFTGKKTEEIFHGDALVPEVEKVEMQVLEISRDGYLGLLESDGTVRKDVKLPRGELGESIQEQFEDGSIIEVVVLSTMGELGVVDFKALDE